MSTYLGETRNLMYPFNKGHYKSYERLSISRQLHVIWMERNHIIKE